MTELVIVSANRFVKRMKTLTNLYAVVGEGGQIQLTDLSGIAIDSV